MRRAKRGVTLVEVMLAASILALMVLALFEGIAVSARVARENAEYLQADAYAFDAHALPRGVCCEIVYDN